jgi:hypothetical protein
MQKIWLLGPIYHFYLKAAWPEILSTLPPELIPSDHLEIVNHVFKMKLNILMDDIKKTNFFGPVNFKSVGCHMLT